jgi:hypothetical protein
MRCVLWLSKARNGIENELVKRQTSIWKMEVLKDLLYIAEDDEGHEEGIIIIVVNRKKSQVARSQTCMQNGRI